MVDTWFRQILERFTNHRIFFHVGWQPAGIAVFQGISIHSSQVLSEFSPTAYGIHHIFPQTASPVSMFVLLIAAAEASLNERREERHAGHFFSSQD
jgi:hypothetical protein